jgi:hypothetical protein
MFNDGGERRFRHGAMKAKRGETARREISAGGSRGLGDVGALVEDRGFAAGLRAFGSHKPMIAFENKRDTEDLSQIMRPIQLLEKLGYVFYHAAWLKKAGDGPCLVGDEFDPQPQPKETLALVPFQPAQRLLLHTAMNIIAVHRDKVSLLESKFEKRCV